MGRKAQKAKDTNYYDMVVSALSSLHDIDKTMYHVIYYGSSDSKSTNDYRDYKEIILAGKWYIPNTDTHKFKRSYGVNIDNNRHRLWAFIQLLCRIGIRLHDGQEYSVYYSSDYSENFIGSIKDYMENKDLPPMPKQASDIPDWLVDRFDSAKIRANYRQEIMELCKYNGSILYYLERGGRYYFRISLRDLYDIIPRDSRKTRKYDKLLAALRKLGIDIKIT